MAPMLPHPAQALDIETLLTVYLMVSVLMLGVIVGGAWQARGRDGLWFWSGAFAAVAFSQGLRPLMSALDLTVPLLTVGHIGGVVSSSMVLLGVRAFLGQPLRWRLIAIVCVCVSALSIGSVASGMRPWVSLSLTLAASSLLRFVAVAPLFGALRSTGGTGSFPLMLMAADQLLAALANGLRAFYVIPVVSGSAQQAMAANALWLLVFIALLVLQGFALLLLINHQLRQRIMALIEIDPLTGLLNRRGLEHRFQRILQRAAAAAQPLGLAAAMVDLDHFKTINDQYGHAVGDSVLRALGNRLEQQVRPQDLAVRLGGEEFAVLWFQLDVDSATTMAERLRRCIEDTPFETDAGPLRVTVSVGVATQTDRHEQLNELLRRADSALYSAKRSGRNRVARASHAHGLEPATR